jgi:hypothetical protein
MTRRSMVVAVALVAFTAIAFAQTAKPVRKAKVNKPKTVKVEEQLPVQIPAKAICPVTKDTWIYAFRPDSNYGGGYGWKDRTDPAKDLTVPKMFLGFGGTDKKLVLLDFDVSKLPKGVAPKRAVVRLYNDYAGSAASTRVAARMVLSAWEENKVTWRAAPRLDTAAVSVATLRGGITYGQPGGWYEWDVAGIISAWMVSKTPCHGIALDPVGDYGVDRDFVCKEYKEKAEFAPVLVVDYGTAADKVPTKESKTQ